MKYYLLLIFSIFALGICSNYFHDAFATCILDKNGKEICAGPPPITINIVLDRQGYTYGDTITATGNVTNTFYQKNRILLMEVHYPDGTLYKSDTVTINKDRTFLYPFILSGNVSSGFYTVLAKDQAQSSVGTGFMFVAEPYTLKINHATYQIQYRIDNGKIDNVTADPSGKSLTIHTVNFVRHATLAIPKTLIDLISSGDKDYEKFNVFVDQRPIKFNEVSDEKTRMLEFDIPPIKKGSSTDLREKSTIKMVLSEPEGAHFGVGQKIPFGILPPLQQFKSGIPMEQIQCKENFQLVIKSNDGSPACVKPLSSIHLKLRNWVDTGNTIEQKSLEYNSAKLIFTNEIEKNIYKVGEKILVTPKLVNIGDKPVTITHAYPPFFISVYDESGYKVWDYPYAVLTIGITVNLDPGKSYEWDKKAMQEAYDIRLGSAGHYKIISNADFIIENGNGVPLHRLYSGMTEITILEK